MWRKVDKLTSVVAVCRFKHLKGLVSLSTPWEGSITALKGKSPAACLLIHAKEQRLACHTLLSIPFIKHDASLYDTSNGVDM